MCEICGCEENKIKIEQDILAQNNNYAAGNREFFLEKNIFAVNLVSSPGSGKTTLLVKTISQLKERFNLAVIEGDQQTNYDKEAIAAEGVPVIQINTGKGCHLDAHMVSHAIRELPLQNSSILFIENVGNLVCPALFDLGEKYRVVILSVTEGDNKPLKYPYMFESADLMLINKIDLLPYVDFNVNKCIEHARRVNPKIKAIPLSATQSNGMEDWYSWLEHSRE